MTVSSICNPHTFQGFNIGLKELRKFLKLQTHFLQPWAKPNFSIYWSRFLISAFVELLLPESRLIFTNKGTRREKGRSRSSSIRRDVINPFSVSLLAGYGRWSECGWERGIEEMESIFEFSLLLGFLFPRDGSVDVHRAPAPVWNTHWHTHNTWTN